MRRSGTGLGGWTPGGLVAGGGYNGGGFGYIQIVAPGGEIESRPDTGGNCVHTKVKCNTEKHI